MGWLKSIFGGSSYNAPNLALPYRIHQANAYTEEFGDLGGCSAWSSRRPYSIGGFLRNFMKMVPFSLGPIFGMRVHSVGRAFCAAILALHVCVVVGNCSDEKVFGLDAPAIVTTVTDAHFSGDWTDEKYVRGAMSGVLPSVKKELPVSVLFDAVPFKAVAVLRSSFKEPLDNFFLGGNTPVSCVGLVSKSCSFFARHGLPRRNIFGLDHQRYALVARKDNSFTGERTTRNCVFELCPRVLGVWQSLPDSQKCIHVVIIARAANIGNKEGV